MRKILFLIFFWCILLSSNLCAKSIKGINVNQSFYPYEMIDSITYTTLKGNYLQNIWFGNNNYCLEINSDLNVSSFELEDNSSWYNVSGVNIPEIQQMFLSNDKIFVLSYLNEFNGENYCIGTLDNENDFVFIEFNENNEVSSIVSKDYLTIIDSHTKDFFSLITIDSNKTFVEDSVFTSSASESIDARKKKTRSTYDSNLVNIINITDYLQGQRNSESHIWNKMGDLASFLLSNLLPEIGGGLYGKIVDLSLEELRRKQKEYLDQMLKILYGNCSIEITDITNQEYNYSVSVRITGTETLPKNRYNNKVLGVYYGLVGSIDKEPDYKSNDFREGHFYTLENTDQRINIGELDVASHYYLKPYLISYNQVKYNLISDNIKYGETKDFSTLTPSCSIIEVKEESITQNSATIKCSFSNICNGVECGLEVESEDFGVNLHTVNSSNGEQEIQLSGLEPGTQYKCYAYVKYNGQMHINRDCVVFITKVPSIEGTWNVVETYSTRPFPGAEWETKTREYTLYLNSDGSVNVEGLGYDYIGGSWGYGNGRFGATCHVIATQTQNSWDRYEGVVDDIKNPQKITGTRYVGNMNQVTNVENAAGSIVMTR